MKKSLLVLGLTLLLTACGQDPAPQPELPEAPVKKVAEEVIQQEEKQPEEVKEDTVKEKEVVEEVVEEELTMEPTKIKEVENVKVTTESGLYYEIFAEGNGQIAKAGDRVRVHYTGWLLDGTKFDSSVDRGEPIEFDLGTRQVILGWDEGVAGMKIGEERRLTIPSHLAYGDRDRGKYIKAGDTLVFDVELIDIVK